MYIMYNAPLKNPAKMPIFTVWPNEKEEASSFLNRETAKNIDNANIVQYT